MASIVDDQQCIVCIVFKDEIGQEHVNSQSDVFVVGRVEDTSSNVEIEFRLENLFKAVNLQKVSLLHTTESVCHVPLCLYLDKTQIACPSTIEEPPLWSAFSWD